MIVSRGNSSLLKAQLLATLHSKDEQLSKSMVWVTVTMLQPSKYHWYFANGDHTSLFTAGSTASGFFTLYLFILENFYVVML